MSRKYEDYDEWCNPEYPRTLSYDDVVAAATTIKPFVLNTPCVPSNYKKKFVMNLYYKLEFLQKTGSIKERGAVNVLQLLSTDRKKIGICTGSIGNDALSLCYYSSKFNIPTSVVMAHGTPMFKLQKLHNLGAQVLVQGSNLLEAQRNARLFARERSLTFINGHDHPHVLAGHGTIALEILEQVPRVDAILVPVGTGGLAAAVATVVKRVKPTCLVYGIQSEDNACLFKSLEASEPLFVPVEGSVADGTAVPIVGYNSFHTGKTILDKILLVKERWISTAMLHLLEKEHYVVEGAGALPLAALIGHLVPELKTKTVVCILSGGNIDSMLLTRCIHRGMAADGRFVKFKIAVKNTTLHKNQLYQLISAGGWNIIEHTEDSVWVANDINTCQISLVCEAKDLEHALNLKRILDKVYSFSAIFATEPFNDKRTCPCHVHKCMKYF